MSRKYHSTKRLLVLLATLAGLFAWPLFSQSVSGTITGYVYDSSDAVIAEAAVTVTNTATGVSTSRQSDSTGRFLVTNLAPGTYETSIEAAGFRRFVQEVILRVDSSVHIDARLELGGVTETVTVSGAPPILKTEKTDVGQYIPEEQLKNLPTFGRNLSKLYNTIPGVLQNSFQIGAGENPSEFNGSIVHGQFFGNSEYEIDGITNTACCFSGFQVIVPNQDSVQEMKLTTAAYDPEFGASAGMVAQYVTQSGTNKLHGSLFEFNRNKVTFAADPFTEKLPNTGKDGRGFGPAPFNWNQFGGSLGGPVKQNKMFLFGDYQGTRARQGGQRTTTVPNNAFRSGDFSTLTANPVFDPLTGDASGAGRTQFPGNRIPTSRLNPVARNLLGILPSANLSQATDVNYVGGGTVLQDTNQWDVRFDYNMSETDKLFVRYTYFGSHLDNPPVFGKEAGGLAVGSLSPQTGDYRSQHVALNYTHTFTPTLLTEVRTGLLRFRLDGYQSDAGLNTNDKVGIPGINTDDILTQGLAGINVQGPVGAWFMGILSGVGIPRLDRTTGLQLVNNWTNIRGSHQLRWGADIRRNRFEFVAVNASTRGNFVFAPSVTGANEAAGSGLGMATFLLGMPSSFDRAVLTGFTSERMWRSAFYVQDIWRATPKLTINYGLRYDYIGPVTPGHPGGIVNFDVNTGDLLLGGLGDVSNTANVKSDLNNFAPRVGLAYKLTSKTVIRAGFGRSYFISNYGSGFYFLTSTYPIATQQTISQATVRSPIFPIEQGPPPATTPEFPASGHLKAPRGQLLKHRPFDHPSEYIDSWNFTIERQLTDNLRISVAYVGNVGRHLWRALNINAAQPGVGPLLDRRPYYQKFGLDTTIQNGCNCENSSYNGLEWVIEKRFAKGYSFNSAFTWSKAIDARGAPNPGFRQSGRGPSEFDRAVSWVMSHSLELPYGPGKKWGASAQGVRKFVLAGWQFHGITTVQSGFPLSPVLSNNASLNGDFTQRPDIVGDYSVSDPNRARWYNPSAFATPACCRLGNAGTNIIRGPGLSTLDWSFAKDFRFGESKRLEFRWESFNFLNHANLALPVNQVDSPTAGRILGLAGSQTFGGAGIVPMRRMQFGLRFVF